MFTKVVNFGALRLEGRSVLSFRERQVKFCQRTDLGASDLIMWEKGTLCVTCQLRVLAVGGARVRWSGDVRVEIHRAEVAAATCFPRALT